MSTPVNLGAVNAMGSQFNTNVFEKVARRSLRTGTKLAKLAPKPVTPASNVITPTTTVTAGTPTKNAPGNYLNRGTSVKTPGGIGSSPAPQAITTGKIATPYTAGATPSSNTGPNFPALPPGRYRGIATPYQGGNRVIPMSGNAALTNRVNPTPGFSDISSDNPINRTAFNQPSQTPFKVNTIRTSSPPKPAYSSTVGEKPMIAPSPLPSGGKASPTVGTQFSDVSTKDNSPFPTHVHPEGSSNQILPNLSAAMSGPGRPNEFTVGSRNIKGGGIAAMGSQLEAGLMRSPIGLPAKKRRV